MQPVHRPLGYSGIDFPWGNFSEGDDIVAKTRHLSKSNRTKTFSPFGYRNCLIPKYKIIRSFLYYCINYYCAVI
jgi:hypothetical protein